MMTPLLQKSELGLANFLWNVEHVETGIGALLFTSKKDPNINIEIICIVASINYVQCYVENFYMCLQGNLHFIYICHDNVLHSTKVKLHPGRNRKAI